jgi:hypothetical protein
MRAEAIRTEVLRMVHQVPFLPFILNLENGNRVPIGHRENIAFDPGGESGGGSLDFYVISGRIRLFSTFEAVTSVATADSSSTSPDPHEVKGAGVRSNQTAVIGRVLQALRNGDIPAARDTLRTEYPFVAVAPAGRRYTELQSLRVFRRDGFIDRYSGQRLLFPGVLRLLSRLLPQEFPFHPNWKAVATHPAYWELFPTIDHVVPVTRGGKDSEENWVTTSMVLNAAKANWTLEELGWSLHPPGSPTEWDGLMGCFAEFVDSDRSLLTDVYLRRWHSAVLRGGDNAVPDTSSIPIS